MDLHLTEMTSHEICKHITNKQKRYLLAKDDNKFNYYISTK